MSELKEAQVAELENAQAAIEVWRTTITVSGIPVLIRLMYANGYYLSISGSAGDCQGNIDVPVNGNGTYKRRSVVCHVGLHGRADIENWKEEGATISFKMTGYWSFDVGRWKPLGTFYPHGSREAFTSQEEKTKALEFVLENLAIDELPPEVPTN